MPNQYTKVELKLEINEINDTTHLKKQYTKAVFEILKNKFPQDSNFIDELINAIKKQL